MMPVKDGFQFCLEKAEDAPISEIPIVIMSADGRVEEKQSRARAMGYIKKPLDIDKVITVIHDLLNS
jgi:CheY-like chemotaxis protein